MKFITVCRITASKQVYENDKQIFTFYDVSFKSLNKSVIGETRAFKFLFLNMGY